MAYTQQNKRTLEEIKVDSQISLSTDKPLTEDLTLMKSRENKTSLELATEGNGARVSGDLEVTGSYKGPLILDGAELKTVLDKELPLLIDAFGIAFNTRDTRGTVKFTVNSFTKFLFDSISGISLYHILDDSYEDPFNIVMGSSGSTTISTTDDGGTNADLTFNADGDITLNSETGVFIAKNSGDEFSAANSAYAGMILGYTALAIDIGDASYTTTTSMAVPHSSLQVTFVAPPSGKVEISVSIFVDTVAGRNLVFGLSDNSTYSPIDFPNSNDVTNEHYVYKGDETDEEDVTHQWVVEGLTAGTSYTWYFGAKAVITAGAYVLKWGGNITGEYAPFIMKATALPATIYTG